MSVSGWRGKEQSFFGLISVTVNAYEKYWDTKGEGILAKVLHVYKKHLQE
jgi:hypothetical protein